VESQKLRRKNVPKESPYHRRKQAEIAVADKKIYQDDRQKDKVGYESENAEVD
jgi:hypothetical protein